MKARITPVKSKGICKQCIHKYCQQSDRGVQCRNFKKKITFRVAN